MPRKVVVIDDDKVTIEILTAILTASGFQVFSESDGVSGLESVIREKPDLVITDLLLPRLDGFGVCAKIKADAELSGIRLVIMTALQNFAFQNEARNCGADLILEKPISREKLQAALGQFFHPA
jgi:DNA-binding response OmpR family regulator